MSAASSRTDEPTPPLPPPAPPPPPAPADLEEKAASAPVPPPLLSSAPVAIAANSAASSASSARSKCHSNRAQRSNACTAPDHTRAKGGATPPLITHMQSEDMQIASQSSACLANLCEMTDNQNIVTQEGGVRPCIAVMRSRYV